MALWKVGRRSFLVEHRLASGEEWLTDTDQAMAEYGTGGPGALDGPDEPDGPDEASDSVGPMRSSRAAVRWPPDDPGPSW